MCINKIRKKLANTTRIACKYKMIGILRRYLIKIVKKSFKDCKKNFKDCKKEF